MSELEYKEHLQMLKDFAKMLRSSKELSEQFLKEVGIIGSDGKLTGIYEECIPTAPTSSLDSTAATKK